MAFIARLPVVLAAAGLAGWLALGCSDGNNPPADGGQDGLVSDGSDAGGDTLGDGGGGDGTCLQTGASCTEATQCCSGRCQNGLCGVCTALGEACAASAECCSGRCESAGGEATVCVLGGGCLAVGQACSAASECCSLSCAAGLCADDVLCTPVAGSCTENAECCSNDCNNDSCQSIGTSCLPLGEPCGGNDASCCSGDCRQIGEEWRCAQSSVCRGEGDVCLEDGDCCTGVCVGGVCPILDECATAGEPCTGFHECCSGLCSDPGTGTPVCQYVSGCRPIGEVCREPDDCCGELCQAAGSTGVLRCEKPNNPGCLAAGETCGGFSQGTSYNCCPPGAGGGAALCLETELGVTRCFGEGTNTQCLADGQPCSFADECCGGYCLPDVDGNLVCGSACVPEGQDCTANADCCVGLLCLDGICSENPYGCVPSGGTCATDAECCTGVCLGGLCTEV